MARSPSWINAFLTNLRLTKGRFAGKYLPYQPFQRSLTNGIFALDEHGNRKINEALVGVGRKNAKTKIAAGWALALLTEQSGGEIVGAAAKRDQARLLLDSAKDFVRSTAFDGVPLEDNLFVLKRNSIVCPATDSVYRIISSDASTELGLNPSVILADELVAWEGAKGQDLWETLTTAQGNAAWRNPLHISITTAGVPTGLWHTLYKRGKAKEAGQREDPHFYFKWWEANTDLDWDDPKAWHQANPGLGTIKSLEYMKRQAAKVGQDLTENAFRRLHLNQPTAAHARWITYDRWKACGDPPDIPEGATVYLGIDAALRRDSFAVAMVYLDDQDPPVAHVRVKEFRPRQTGDYIDPREVETYVLGLSRRYRIREVRYDPYAMEMLAVRLADAGLRTEAMPQQGRGMSRAAETLQRFVLDGLLRHGMDEVLDAHMAAVEVRESDNGVRISKGRSEGVVDGVVALAMAMDAMASYEITTLGHFAVNVNSGDAPREERTPAPDRADPHEARPVLAERVRKDVRRGRPVRVPRRRDYPDVRRILTAIMGDGDESMARTAEMQRDQLDRKYERTKETA